MRRRGRHVRARRASLSHLCNCGDANRAALHGDDDGFAGVPGVDERGPCRNAGDREVRNGLNREDPSSGVSGRMVPWVDFCAFGEEQYRFSGVMHSLRMLAGGLHDDRKTVLDASGDDTSQVCKFDEKPGVCGGSDRKGRRSQIAGRRRQSSEGRQSAGPRC